jgi:Putative transposase DNA-binding domain
MAELTATATCTAFRAAEVANGRPVPARLLVTRVERLADLAHELTAALVAAHWSDRDLLMVWLGVGPDGRALPAKGWMAMRRLGWAAVTPEDVYVSDRVRRVAEEAAARALRLAAYRRTVVNAIVATWPADPSHRTRTEWAALYGRLPQGVSCAEVRNRTRQLRAWQRDHGGRLPASLTELEDPPTVTRQVLLAAADRQLVSIQRIAPNAAILRVKLPLTGRPVTSAEWVWHAVRLTLPDHVATDAKLCAPTLRATRGRVRVDLPWRIPAPPAPRAGHTVALGLDWGVNTLLTGTIGKLAITPTGTRVITDGRMLRFDATGMAAKLHRLRVNRERVAARRDHYARLREGFSATDRSEQRVLLHAKHAVLTAEHQRICDRIRGLNRALAWAAARWVVDQAQALDATVIYVEDLATLEARRPRRGNARLSGQVRRKVVDAIRHLAARVGLLVMTVPPRGTSKRCPRCHAVLRHSPAPDRTHERGWKWAVCHRCGLAGDRDHAASERIIARGLLGQTQLHSNRKTGHHAVAVVVEGNVARARRSRRRIRAVWQRVHDAIPRRPYERQPPLHRPAPGPARQISRRVPDRRAVPTPATPSRVAGKRPVGSAPKSHRHLRVGMRSGPNCDCLPRSGCLRRPSAGWGFHRGVRATVVLPLGDYGPPSFRPRPPRVPVPLRESRQSETLSVSPPGGPGAAGARTR